MTSLNCGIDNQHVDVLSAENNYWGSAAGPGSDPADAACGDVDAVPFATRAFPISTDAGR